MGVFSGWCVLDVNVRERDGAVQATGMLGGVFCGGPYSVSGTGVWLPPDVQLALAFGGNNLPVHFAGRMIGDSIHGQMNGAGLVAQPVTLGRVK